MSVESFWESTPERMPVGEHIPPRDRFLARVEKHAETMPVAQAVKFRFIGEYMAMTPEERKQDTYERRCVRQATNRAYVALYRDGFVITSNRRDEIGEF